MLKRQKGQGMVEFALVSPVLLLIILAIIETALIFQGYLAVQHAAREAARWAVTGQPDQGMTLNGSSCDGTPLTGCDPNETSDQYAARRVEMIKQIAVESAVGLRIDNSRLGLSPATFDAYKDEPNFFGVEIWGFPSFVEPGGGWTEGDLSDQPGLPGLPVRVRVSHNVELLDPIFQAVVPRVRVTAQSEMINEGTQAGFGSVAPPSLPPPPPLPQPGDPGSGGSGIIVDFSSVSFDVSEADGQAVITVVLSEPAEQLVTVEYATADGTATAGSDYVATSDTLTFNPGVTSRTFNVSIHDDTLAEGAETVVLTLFNPSNADLGNNTPAILLILDDDASAVVHFSSVTYSVNEGDASATVTVVLDSASGNQVTVDYATSDGTATAGADYTAASGTLTFEPGITSQTFEVLVRDDVLSEGDETINLNLSNPVNATLGSRNPAALLIRDDDLPPTPTPTGAFIAVSDYLVIPNQVILIDVNQHTPNGVYELVWVDADTGADVQVIDPAVQVDGSGFRLAVQFTVPADSEGSYYIETRGDVIVQSALIEAMPLPPDLVVNSIGVPEEIIPNEDMTVTVELANLTDGLVSGYFDVDVYIDPDYEIAQGRPGASKQWVQGIGPGETLVITHIVTLNGGGAHELWAQVDTSNWVPGELDETNNIFGPLGVTALTGECSEMSDRFYGPDLESKWISAIIGNASVHNLSIDEVEGTLIVESNGNSLFNASGEGSTLAYQEVTGDFVATLRIIQPLEGSGQQWAKVGLMARASVASNSRWVMAMRTRDGLQFAFRRGSSGERFASDVSTGSPLWVRLVRTGDTFAGYYSTDGSNWTPGTGDGENGGVTVDMAETILIGIAASSYSSTPGTAIVDDFEVCPLGADAETCQAYSDDFDDGVITDWIDLDIGNPLPGSSSESGGSITVNGDGTSIWGTNDSFHYTYKQVPGNFVATINIQDVPDTAEFAKAGLMLRASTDPGSAQVMLVNARDSGIQFASREDDGDSTNNIGDYPGYHPWVRLSRSGNAVSAFYSSDGENWVYQGSTTANLPEQILIGMAVSSYDGLQVASGQFDDFVFCAAEAGDVAPPLPEDEEKPPGLKECIGNPDTLMLGDFEAPTDQVNQYWPRNADTFHAHSAKRSGNFSLGFRASVGPRPEYKHLSPWAYQSVSVPGDLLDDSTGTLSLWQFVVPDPEGLDGDPDDYFYMVVRNSAGMTQTAPILLAQGNTDTPVFQQQVISIETYLPGNGLVDLAGEDIELRFYGVHDGEESGTYFYIDDVELEICTTYPIPADEPGTASFGGLVEVLLGGVPRKLGTNVQVSASLVGGDMYRTRTIHDSTYHFYNMPPGTYVVYAQAEVRGQGATYLYTAIREVTVTADERNYGFDMLLK